MGKMAAAIPGFKNFILIQHVKTPVSLDKPKSYIRIVPKVESCHYRYGVRCCGSVYPAWIDTGDLKYRFDQWAKKQQTNLKP
jgi:hypothetical protein